MFIKVNEEEKLCTRWCTWWRNNTISIDCSGVYIFCRSSTTTSSAAMCRSRGPPASLLITSRGIQQPSRPSHHTTHSNKPPILASVYICSRRAASSVIHREARLGSRHKRTSYHMHLSPALQSTHADVPAGMYVPAQHRHASVDTHDADRVAVLHQLPSAARRDAPMLHLSFVID